jgi:hypothetical protein
LAPSPIADNGRLVTPTGQKGCSVPREMTRDDIATVTREHAAAARRALDAGALCHRLANDCAHAEHSAHLRLSQRFRQPPLRRVTAVPLDAVLYVPRMCFRYC